MDFDSRYIPVGHAERFGRLLVALAMLPVLVLSPLTAQAILIHDHHGHETHGHSMTLRDLDDLRENSEHHHEEHEHHGLPVDPAGDQRTPILIVIDLPEALPGARTLSVAVAVGVALRTLAITSRVVEDGRSIVESHQTLAHIPRARSLITGILRTNHALLL